MEDRLNFGVLKCQLLKSKIIQEREFYITAEDIKLRPEE
jgi:hypothetical protein